MSTTTEQEAKRYNGWTNYETWVVKLWMDNEEGSNGYWHEQSEEIRRESEGEDEAVRTLAAVLKGHHEDGMQELLGGGANVYADLLGGALSEVNWREIAEGMLEE